jgi:dTDP-glucose pyrophosphorylase
MDIRNRNINANSTIIEAFKKMDQIDKKLLIVFDGQKYLGLISAGDIQRALIKNDSFETKVSKVMRKNIVAGNKENTLDEIKELMLKHRIELFPIVDNNKLIKIYFWEDLFAGERQIQFKPFNLPIVIMAGGLGTRLKPLTNILPKGIIPIGSKTIIEEIFYRFSLHGCHKFYISTNYKAELLEFYLSSLNLPFELEYINESIPMGTAGSLSLLNEKINQTFFVSNCDILIEQDYSEILTYHRENENEITVVAALKHYSLPYGTIDSGDNGILKVLNEKPELTFKINSGMYILEPHVINDVPLNQFYHITDLIRKIKDRKGKVGVFPVSENSWKDIGEWDLFFKENKIKYNKGF